MICMYLYDLPLSNMSGTPCFTIHGISGTGEKGIFQWFLKSEQKSEHKNMNKNTKVGKNLKKKRLRRKNPKEKKPTRSKSWRASSNETMSWAEQAHLIKRFFTIWGTQIMSGSMIFFVKCQIFDICCKMSNLWNLL